MGKAVGFLCTRLRFKRSSEPRKIGKLQTEPKVPVQHFGELNRNFWFGLWFEPGSDQFQTELRHH
jgi:hypothetical protein